MFVSLPHYGSIHESYGILSNEMWKRPVVAGLPVGLKTKILSPSS